MNNTLNKLLEEIADTKRMPASGHLARLSNLSETEREQLSGLWPAIGPARKERIAKILIELAEDNVELNFDYIFRLCLDDPSPAVRVAGIEGLVECEESWLMDRLIRMLRSDESREVRAASALALGRFALMAELGEIRARAGEKVDAALLSTFEDEQESIEVRRRALESLGVRIGERTAQAISRAYASEERQLRIGALYAMGRYCDERWLNTILQELKSPDVEMRYEAVVACGEIEDQRAVPYLIPLLQDADIQIRLAVVTSLGHIGGPRAKEELSRLLHHSNEQIRDAAEEALEELTFGDAPITFGLGN